MRFPLHVLGIATILLGGLTRASADVTDDLYLTKIRPILSANCLKCHGPDERTRKGKLRLDQRESAIKPARSGKVAIVPGKPEDSEIMARILTEDESEVMPPPSSKLSLTREQKDLLKRWIQQGAEFKPHWAFVGPTPPDVPRIADPATLRNPIDAFIQQRLRKEGLSPSPPADRHALIRRVSLDLVGLPPSPEEIAAFVNDTRPDAYERLVDRLLASPAYGERWARKWLDLARYADTNGYEKDRVRSIWPFRDWVIAALNADMPFDRFTIEQLAGDMLPGSTLDQRVATGFHRNTMINEEGGIDPLEFRYHAMNDRVATTGTVWLGLTLNCANCHSHKYDPISQKEYFGLFAFLNNADEPQLEILGSQQQSRKAKVLEEIETLRKRRRELHGAALSKEFSAWLAEQRGKIRRWNTVRPTSAKSNLPLLTVESDQSIFVTGDMSKSDTYEVNFSLSGPVHALRLEVLPDERLPGRGPGRVYYEGPEGDFFLSEFSLLVDGKKVPIQKAEGSFSSGGNNPARAIDGDQQTGWSINGGQGKPHQAIFLLEKPITGTTGQVRLLFEKYYAAGLGRFRLSVSPDAGPIQPGTLPVELEAVVLGDAASMKPADRDRLLDRFLDTAKPAEKETKAIRDQEKQLPSPQRTLVLQERPRENPRPTFVHHRGEFLQPTEKVEPFVLAALHVFPPDREKNRLEFARWLVAPENPLMSRVTVNRHWGSFFGNGLVATLQDFGFQGGLPSHPELLDWLALEFRDRGWSFKHLHRLLVTSATYQQQSVVRPDHAAKDPTNRLLARGPRLRLEGEIIRDSILSASGLLAMKLGGPSVFPPQPPEVTTEGAYGQLQWKTSEGADRHRRSLYTFQKRTAPFALYGTFDAPSGEVCQARREVSNTPLQSLMLLNDQEIMDASRTLAEKVATSPGSLAERIQSVFLRVVGRPIQPGEQGALEEFYTRQKQKLATAGQQSAIILGGSKSADPDRAAWVLLIRALFNLDETITKG